MIVDLSGIALPSRGTQDHWAMLTAVSGDAVIFGPLRAEIARIVAAAITVNPTAPFISSRQAGAEALEAVGSAWHAQFARHFPNFPNGAASGVFGMALWEYLANHPDRWCFSGVVDPYGYGHDSKVYWRP